MLHLSPPQFDVLMCCACTTRLVPNAKLIHSICKSKWSWSDLYLSWVTPNRCLCLIDSNTASFWGWNWLLGYECPMIWGSDDESLSSVDDFWGRQTENIYQDNCYCSLPWSMHWRCNIWIYIWMLLKLSNAVDFCTNVIIGNKNFIWTNPYRCWCFL